MSRRERWLPSRTVRSRGEAASERAAGLRLVSNRRGCRRSPFQTETALLQRPDGGVCGTSVIRVHRSTWYRRMAAKGSAEGVRVTGFAMTIQEPEVAVVHNGNH
jgi:hypothetical protein